MKLCLIKIIVTKIQRKKNREFYMRKTRFLVDLGTLRIVLTIGAQKMDTGSILLMYIMDHTSASIAISSSLLKSQQKTITLESTTELSLLKISNKADWELLLIETALYINSDVRGAPQYRNMQTPISTKELVQCLEEKQGRLCQNLYGKRLEYTRRVVISPDPNLKITEVGAPIVMAQILTYAERVSEYKNPWPNSLGYPYNNLMSLTYARSRAADELKCGSILLRQLEEGDVGLFNKQLSLHRLSITSHRARVMPWSTLRFNESVCNPYNADLVGDEMNLYVPQTEVARTEALTLMVVQNHLCTPKHGEIPFASTQDFLTSSFSTRKDTFYDRASFPQMCSCMGDALDSVELPSPAIAKPIERWTEKHVFSVLCLHARTRVYFNLAALEKNYTSEEKMCAIDGCVYFRNSELISGQLGKAILGNGKKDGLFSGLLREYYEYSAAFCINRLPKLSACWISNHGFSIGKDDVQPSGELEFKSDRTITEGYKRCDHYIQFYNKMELHLQPGCDSAQTEAEITFLPF